MYSARSYIFPGREGKSSLQYPDCVFIEYSCVSPPVLVYPETIIAPEASQVIWEWFSVISSISPVKGSEWWITPLEGSQIAIDEG